MIRSRFPRPLVLAAALALTVAGCGDNDDPAPLQPEPVSPLPSGTPLNDTPQNTMIRFEVAYENQALTEYLALFTNDFSFRFSTQSDPALVSQFGSTWGVTRDSASTRHLFDGFTNEQGDFLPGASDITLSLAGPQFVADPDRPDSAAFYKLVIVPTIFLDLTISGGDGYAIAAPHDFHLVRGDAAVLRPGQVADSTRWYLHRWTDKSTTLALIAPRRATPAHTMPARDATWGTLKALYLE
jgi:hypothetical protein